jgi:DhnA family fructose-bisphosphate aldolase class Ia
MANSKIQAEVMEYRVMKDIPLIVTWTAGVPAVSFNPENEAVTLTDNGAGDLTITLGVASLVPVMVKGLVIQVADANTLSLEANIDGATSTTVVKLVFNSGADGATETDPVAAHIVLSKMVVA